MWALGQAGEGKQQAGGGNEALLMPSFAEEEVDLVSEIERTVGLLLASPSSVGQDSPECTCANDALAESSALDVCSSKGDPAPRRPALH